MAQPNTKNAQIRTGGKRASPDVQAEDAQRLLDDPAFIRGFSAVHEGLVNEISNLKHDGQPATDDYERELCRTLRTLKSVRRAIALGVQGQKLRLAEFKAHTPEVED